MTAPKGSPLQTMLAGALLAFLLLGAVWFVLWLCGFRFWGLD